MKRFNLKIKEGKLTFSSDTHKALFNQFLKDNEDKIAEVSIYKPIRSNQQNRLYWLYLGVISSETGDDPVSLHQYFKRAFLPPKFISVMGKEIKVPCSTTELNKSDFAEYIIRIEAETKITCPNPKDLEGFIPN